MHRVTTGDHTETLYSQEYEETYHSSHGALREAFTKFCSPCKIIECAKRGSINILDIGFGLGYNVLSAIYLAKRANKVCNVTITSLEKELLSPRVLNTLTVPKEYFEDYRRVKLAAEARYYEADNIKVSILEGDARKTIRRLDNQFDAVFFDPFSVKKNPEMWTVDFLREVGKRMKGKAILSTYSAATPVRCGLMEAGFRIGPAPGDGMKKEGTLASRKGDVGCFSDKIVSRLKNSPERTPYYDPHLNFSRNEILDYRKALMQQDAFYSLTFSF